MLFTGKQIRLFGKDAVILTYSEDEDQVLIFVDKDCIKWVDKRLIDLMEYSA